MPFFVRLSGIRAEWACTEKGGEALSFRAVLPQDGLQHLLLQQALLQLRQEFVNLDQQGGGTDGLAFF